MKPVSNRSKMDHQGQNLTETVPLLTLFLTYGLTLFIGVCVGLCVSQLGITL